MDIFHNSSTEVALVKKHSITPHHYSKGLKGAWTGSKFGKLRALFHHPAPLFLDLLKADPFVTATSFTLNLQFIP
jgi:hypothetical protein